MKTIPLRLTEEQYDVLRALAFEQRTSMAALVRRAVEKAYHEDFEDVRIMEEELAAHRADPSSSMDFEKYLKARARHTLKGEAEELRDYTDAEIEQFLAEDAIDGETAQAVRRLLARMRDKGKSP